MFDITGFRTATYAIGLALAVSLAPATQAQTIVNGGFENPTLAPWTASGLVFANALSRSAEGSFSAELGFGSSFSPADGTFSQDFTIATAGMYTLAFSLGRYAPFCGCSDVALSFRALFDGAVILDVLPPVAGSTAAQTQFTGYSGQGFLSAGQHSLTFSLSRGGSGFARSPQFLLDAVNVTPITAPGVPEPSAWALLILGFGMVGAGMRRRRLALAFS